MLLLEARSLGINPLAFSPDGTRLTAGCRDGYLQTWDLTSGVLLHEPVLGPDTNDYVAYAGEVVVVLLRTGHACVIDPATGAQLRRVPPPGHRAALCACLHPGGELLALSMSERVTLYSLADGTKVRSMRRPPVVRLRVTALGISASGERLILGCEAGNCQVFQTATGKHVATLATPRSDMVRAAVFSPDGRFAAVCAGPRLRLYDVDADELVRETSVGRTHFVGAAWHPSGEFFATANGDGKVDYWDARSGERRESFDWKVGKLHDVVFDASGHRAACCSQRGQIVVWDVDR